LQVGLKFNRDISRTLEVGESSIGILHMLGTISGFAHPTERNFSNTQLSDAIVETKTAAHGFIDHPLLDVRVVSEGVKDQRMRSCVDKVDRFIDVFHWNNW